MHWDCSLRFFVFLVLWMKIPSSNDHLFAILYYCCCKADHAFCSFILPYFDMSFGSCWQILWYWKACNKTSATLGVVVGSLMDLDKMLKWTCSFRKIMMHSAGLFSMPSIRTFTFQTLTRLRTTRTWFATSTTTTMSPASCPTARSLSAAPLRMDVLSATSLLSGLVSDLFSVLICRVNYYAQTCVSDVSPTCIRFVLHTVKVTVRSTVLVSALIALLCLLLTLSFVFFLFVCGCWWQVMSGTVGNGSDHGQLLCAWGFSSQLCTTGLTFVWHVPMSGLDHILRLCTCPCV